MKAFMDRDFLLTNETAKHLYHDYAERLPIIDYHCHINPSEIEQDLRYDSITQVWLGGDHYKWRAMRSAGVPEYYVTGDAPLNEKFQKWAETLPMAIGNPLYHWSHLELQRYFGIHEPLNGGNAQEIYQKCNEKLAQPDMSVRGLIRQSNVELICTTDDPVDDLKHHEAIAADTSFATRVLPAFRPDKAMNVNKETFAPYMERLEQVCGFPIDSVKDLCRALSQRIEYFAAHGCRVSDHALDYCVCREASETELDRIFQNGRKGGTVTQEETESFQTYVLRYLAKEYTRLGWVMQIHFGCLRNHSAKMYRKLGADTGFDSVADYASAENLGRFLSSLEEADSLPKMVLYSLNPADNYTIGTIMGCFQTDGGCAGRIQFGSAWWFNDHKPGMEKQMTDLASLGLLGGFVGMLTDSRSFLSYTRHEYFRRILCNLIGTWVENGEYPNDEAQLKQLVENISYYNTRNFFGFDR